MNIFMAMLSPAGIRRLAVEARDDLSATGVMQGRARRNSGVEGTHSMYRREIPGNCDTLAGSAADCAAMGKHADAFLLYSRTAEHHASTVHF